MKTKKELDNEIAMKKMANLSDAEKLIIKAMWAPYTCFKSSDELNNLINLNLLKKHFIGPHFIDVIVSLTTFGKIVKDRLTVPSQT